MHKRILHCAAVAAWTLILALGGPLAGTSAAADGPRFEVSYSASAHPGPITGRLILILATREKPEPRLTVSPLGPAIFGVDLDQLPPGQAAVVDASTLGSPQRSLAELPSGDYYVQAVIHVYTKVRRADGHTVWVYLNDGMRETFNLAAGNLYSDVQRVNLGESRTF